MCGVGVCWGDWGRGDRGENAAGKKACMQQLYKESYASTLMNNISMGPYSIKRGWWVSNLSIHGF